MRNVVQNRLLSSPDSLLPYTRRVIAELDQAPPITISHPAAAAAVASFILGTIVSTLGEVNTNAKSGVDEEGRER